MTTLQEKLGYAATDKLLIIHADDVGMCQATVTAWQALWPLGIMTSASAMAPCPWFPALCEAAQAAGGKADIGLHLTLNCELRDTYRWGPISAAALDAGFADDAGFLHPLAAITYEKADLGRAFTEFAAQMNRAKQLGLPLTHIDSHMLTAWHPVLLEQMIALGEVHHLPVMIPDFSPEIVAEASRMPADLCRQSADLIAKATHQQRLLPITGMAVLPFHTHLQLAERLDWVASLFDQYANVPGVFALIGHPADDTPELRAITASWPTRVADRTLMASAQLAALCDQHGFKRIGMAELLRAQYGR